MSVENLANPDGRIEAFLPEIDRWCCYCGTSLEAVIVYWNGVGVKIALHPGCAKDLATRLIADGFTAERLLAGKPLLGGIDKSLIPEGEA